MTTRFVVHASRTITALAVLAAFALTLWPLAEVPSSHAQQAPTVTANPSAAAPNASVTLQGTGWPSNAQLVARLYERDNLQGPSSPLGGVIQTDAAGSFSSQGTVPLSLFGQGSRGTLSVVPGDYTLIVAGGSGISASTPFNVGAPAQGVLLWGQLYFDTNNTGAIDAGDTPSGGLSGVTVTGPNPDSPTRQGITDAKGRYVMLDLPAGSYTISAKGQAQSRDWSGTASAATQSGQAVRADVLLRAQSGSVNPARYFQETGFGIDNDAFWDYFNKRGGIRTLGFPISRTFTFQGYPTQFFQRIVLQAVPGQGVQRPNLLDPGLMPYTNINGSQFPAVDPAVKAATPTVGSANYDEAVIEFVRRHSPNAMDVRRTGFFDAFMSTVTARDAFPEGGGEDLVPLLNLEIWGTPTSNPTSDPRNSNFIYLRFQRGILHFQGYDSAGRPITEGILLGDWFKSLITGRDLPADLEAQARADNSPFLRQYDSNRPGWVADASRLPNTDLSFAFERQ